MSVFLLAVLAWQPAVPPPAPPLITLPVAPPIAGLEKEPPPAELFARAVPPKPEHPLISYVSDNDYPPAVLRAGEQGLVAFALRIDRTGTPVGCSVLQTSGSVLLDMNTCRIMLARARFEPAKDASGRVVESAFRAKMRWAMPAQAAPAAAIPDELMIRFELAPDGTASNCSGSLRMGRVSSSMTDPTCERVRTPEAALARMAKEAGGKPVVVTNRTRLLRNPDEPWPDASTSGIVLSRSLLRLVVDASGSATSCTVLDSSGPLGGRTCPWRTPSKISEPETLKLPSEIRAVVTVVAEPLSK